VFLKNAPLDGKNMHPSFKNVVFTNDNGEFISGGFAPEKDSMPIWTGTVKRYDYLNYDFGDGDYQRAIAINDEQFQILKSFINDPAAFNFDMNYNAASNSCIDFTYKALEIAGINTDKEQDDDSSDLS
jgi:hypothetical protein